MTTKQQLREALELYANADYEGTGFWDGISTPGILRDKGRVAKEALALPSQRPDDEGVDDIQLLYLREDIAERFNQMPHPYEIADAVMAIVRPYLRAKPDAIAELIARLQKEIMPPEVDSWEKGFNYAINVATLIVCQHFSIAPPEEATTINYPFDPSRSATNSDAALMENLEAAKRILANRWSLNLAEQGLCFSTLDEAISIARQPTCAGADNDANDVAEAREALAAGDFLGHEESERVIQNIISAGAGKGVVDAGDVERVARAIHNAEHPGVVADDYYRFDNWTHRYRNLAKAALTAKGDAADRKAVGSNAAIASVHTGTPDMTSPAPADGDVTVGYDGLTYYAKESDWHPHHGGECPVQPVGLTFLSIEAMDAAQVAYQQYIGPDKQVDLALMATIIKTYARVVQKAMMRESRIDEKKLEEVIAKEVHALMLRIKKPIIDAKGIVPEATYQWWDFVENREYENIHPDFWMQLNGLAKHIIEQSRKA